VNACAPQPRPPFETISLFEGLLSPGPKRRPRDAAGNRSVARIMRERDWTAILSFA